MALLALDQVTFAYPDAAHPALDGVSLVFSPGSYTVVAGPSGCGKTTLLRALKTPLAPVGRWEGAVLCDGAPLAEVPLRDQARCIGFVVQSPTPRSSATPWRPSWPSGWRTWALRARLSG